MENRTGGQAHPINDERTLKDLTPNVMALLCYVGGWISGIIFLVLEQKNRFVRFHALQSIIVFGILTLAGTILGNIPFFGPAFSLIIGTIGFVCWIILMIKGYNGEMFKMPGAGDLAERLSNETREQPQTQYSTQNKVAVGTEEKINPAQPAKPVSPEAAQSTKQAIFRAKYYSTGARTGRIVGSSFAIAGSLVLLIFFNFYNQYIAYYQLQYSAGMTRWDIHTLVTGDINSWLPLVTATLALGITGHILLIIFDKFTLRQIVNIILDVLGAATVLSLLAIYPFNFSVIPNIDAAYRTEFALTAGLIVLALGFGIGALVRFIRLMVNIAEGKY